MRKEMQTALYQRLGFYLTTIRNHKKISVSQLATRSGEQFNTVEAIMNGKRFSFHHGIWIYEILEASLDQLILNAMDDIRKEALNDEQNIKEEINEKDIDGFI